MRGLISESPIDRVGTERAAMAFGSNDCGQGRFFPGILLHQLFDQHTGFELAQYLPVPVRAVAPKLSLESSVPGWLARFGQVLLPVRIGHIGRDCSALAGSNYYSFAFGHVDDFSRTGSYRT